MINICSIVYLGFKDGLKFVKGDFNQNIEKVNRNTELDKLADQFNVCMTNEELTDATIDDEAKRFLKDNGWTVVYSDYCANIDESMSEKEAEDFIEKARNNEVKFKYKKIKDNSTRVARGTLKEEVIKHGLALVKKAKKAHHIPDSVIVYWDLEKKMFRCFRKSNFIGYVK